LCEKHGERDRSYYSAKWQVAKVLTGDTPERDLRRGRWGKKDLTEKMILDGSSRFGMDAGSSKRGRAVTFLARKDRKQSLARREEK